MLKECAGRVFSSSSDTAAKLVDWKSSGIWDDP